MGLTGLTGNELVFDNVFAGAASLHADADRGDRPDGALERSELRVRHPGRSNIIAAASTRQATGTSVTMSWTLGSANSYWAIAAVPINPAPTGPPHDLTMDVSPSGGGTTTPAVGVHTYAEGTVVNISATPNPGYVFDHWTGDVANPNSASTTVTMDADKTVTAYFVVSHDLTMGVSPSGGGTTAPAVGVHTYAAGTVVNISATPNTGYVFDHWTGDVADPNSASTTVTMDAAKTVTAHFVAEEYTLTVNVVGHGSVAKAPDQATYHYGDQVLLTATPAFGYEFAGWSGDLADGASPQTVTMNGNKAVTATFEQYVPMSLGVDGTPSNGTGAANASSVTFAHTTGTGTDRLMLVGVSWNCGTADRTISSVTFTPSGGSAIDLTEVFTQNAGGTVGPALLRHLQAARSAEGRHGNGDRHLQRPGQQRQRGRRRRLRRRRPERSSRDRRRSR